ncbi:glycosyltransferase family 4 protein [Paenibacillus sp. MMO-58]|uniref:glycosyltransferase family 4 protein n=1 Tax=Paenibacillus sp. MMO-58 TaxID=3081290 RepID=UPI00301A3494
MIKKKVCFIAQFPPPIHGLSKAVDTLYNSYLSDEFEFERINITNNKNFFGNLYLIWKSNASLFYFTISQTKAGNIRDLIILFLLKLQRKKCLVHLHGGNYRKLIDNELKSWQRKINFSIIKKLEGVIVLGPSLRSIFQGMINEEKIHLVPNCVDDEFLMSENQYKEKIVALENKEVLDILYLSNFIKSKGYPEVLEMAKLEKERVISGEIKRYHFNFAGEFFTDSDLEYFENYIKNNDLQSFVTYYGVVSGQSKKELLEKCDIFVLLTRYPNEGQPISILEAMGNAMVIVTTDHAGIPDIVENEINGIVTYNSSVKEVFNKILEMDPHKHCSISKNNREMVKTFFVQSCYLSNMERIFKSIK